LPPHSQNLATTALFAPLRRGDCFLDHENTRKALFIDEAETDDLCRHSILHVKYITRRLTKDVPWSIR
jgi:hypothetical protein